jgi:putative N6-adenine-specific DNA methylase
LHRRGYRVAMTDAPLKETLAAAVLALGRVDDDRPVVDPMCGSGTLAIEHALAARRIAPGLRRRFGFQRWPLFGEETTRRAWLRLVDAARAEVLPSAPAPILCSDRFADAIEAARKNAAAAGVARDIAFAITDVRDAQPPAGAPGNLVMNPPYGERLMGAPGGGGPAAAPTPWQPPRRQRTNPGARNPRAPLPREEHVQQLKLAGLYRGIAGTFDRFKGWGAVVLSGNPLWTDEIRRRPLISHRLFNGPLEVRLLRYEL